MALSEEAVKELISKLDADREAYLNTLNKAHLVLNQALTSVANSNSTSNTTLVSSVVQPNTSIGLTKLTDLQSVSSEQRLTHYPILRNHAITTGESVRKTSMFSGDDDEVESEHDESFFVQKPLAPESWSENDLVNHVKTHKWKSHGRRILEDILDDARFRVSSGGAREEVTPSSLSIFPPSDDLAKDRSNMSHGEVFDVGADGAPIQLPSRNTTASRAQKIWQYLNNTNADEARLRKAVGRIVILREPSPILFGAIHCTHQNHFDMDEIFQLLADDSVTTAHMFRAFKPEPIKQRTFIFSFKYFTIIGDNCKPRTWQQSDEELNSSDTHIPITRCSSIVALHLSGDPISSVKNRARQRTTDIGNVYDPFAPWRVLSIQCFPDWKSTMDTHDSARNYVNGPEAFMASLKAEFHDARKRFREINERIVRLATPPSDFMFNPRIRDELLFEDDTYTYSRRYFWCYQTLAIMNDSIQAMIRAYTETFSDQVWAGKHKTLWPGTDDASPRTAFWRRRMANLKNDLDREVRELEKLFRRNIVEQKEIEALRDHLFSGTSVQESRNSVEQAQITVQQGNNIKLLTLITIFFLPLTYVTSIFGMTALPQDGDFTTFGIVTAVICLPTYLLVGSMNTDGGMRFWQKQSSRGKDWTKKALGKSSQSVPHEAPTMASLQRRRLSNGLRKRPETMHRGPSSPIGAPYFPNQPPGANRGQIKFGALTMPLAAHFNPSARINAHDESFVAEDRSSSDFGFHLNHATTSTLNRIRRARTSFSRSAGSMGSGIGSPTQEQGGPGRTSVGNIDEEAVVGVGPEAVHDGERDRRPSLSGGSSIFRTFSDRLQREKRQWGSMFSGETGTSSQQGSAENPREKVVLTKTMKKNKKGRRGLSFGESDLELA